MTTAGPNYISGITTATNSTDVVNKEYVDNKFGSSLPSQTGNSGKFLVTTDGTSTSWDYVSNYQEYTSVGTYTFTVPAQANLLYVESTGGGGGGSTGATGPTLAKSGFTWTLRTTGFGSTSITSLATNGSTNIASGNSGTLRSSTNDITWTLRTSGFGTTNINSSTYFNNEFLIGGTAETVSWILRTSGFGTSAIQGLTYGNGIYVAAVDSSGFLRASTDGITWVARTSPPISPFGDTQFGTYDGTNYFIVGGSVNPGRLLTSTNTIVWVLRTSGFGTSWIGTISYGSDKTEKYIIAGQGGRLSSSTDSIRWTLRTSGFGSSSIFCSTYDGSSYYVGGSGTFLRASTNGIFWTTRTSPLIGGNISSIIYASDTYVATSSVGWLQTSTNGIEWTLRTSGFGTSGIRGLVYNNNLYVTASVGGRIATSTDTITWTTRTSGTTQTFVGIESDGTNYVAGATSGVLVTSTQTVLSSLGSGAFLRASTDGVFWTTRTNDTLNSQRITLLASAGSYSFAHGTNYVESSDFLNVSTDNITWELRTSGFGTTKINAFAYGTVYIAGGIAGTLTSSTDTITWTLRTSGFDVTDINTLIYGNNLYVAAGNFGCLTTSTDTITWTLRTTSNNGDNINTLSYSSNANNYIFAGSNGDIFSSSDAITWRVNTSNAISNLLTSIHLNSAYLVAGESGTLTRALAQYSGTGGSSASHTSWYIPKSIVTSNITVNVGAGGTGATTENTSGPAGAGTTVSWTGPEGTYQLVANGGGVGGVAGIAQTSITSYYYTTEGLVGAASTNGVGVDAFAQINLYQPTGGGSGAGVNSSVGGAGGIITFYGNTAFSAGGNSSGSNGATGIAITSLPYGQGGGGGGSGASTAGSGGNGILGGGGGGGAVISSAFGNGGNGGDGFVRITWW